MYTNNKLSKAVRLAIAFGAASSTAFTTSVSAAEDEVAKVERIEVTGSRIKRTDLEGSTPVTVFSREDIDKRGVATVAEFLRYSTAVSGGFNESATLSQAAGASSINLKG